MPTKKRPDEQTQLLQAYLVREMDRIWAICRTVFGCDLRATVVFIDQDDLDNSMYMGDDKPGRVIEAIRHLMLSKEKGDSVMSSGDAAKIMERFQNGEVDPQAN